MLPIQSATHQLQIVEDLGEARAPEDRVMDAMTGRRYPDLRFKRFQKVEAQVHRRKGAREQRQPCVGQVRVELREHVVHVLKVHARARGGALCMRILARKNCRRARRSPKQNNSEDSV